MAMSYFKRSGYWSGKNSVRVRDRGTVRARVRVRA